MTITSFARIGTANTFDASIRNISKRETALSSLQANLTSGKKIVQTSDDPTGAAQAERALTRINRIATDQRALESQRNAITMAESTLGDITDALQNFRELVVNSGNGGYSAAERKSIAVQLTGLRDQVITLANRSDTNGQPLFSALGSALTPFVGPNAEAPDYTFNGLPGQTASSDVAIPFTLDGDSAFMLQTGRDRAYNVKMTLGPGAPRQYPLGTSATTITDQAALTADVYTITIDNVTLGSTPKTGIATYTIKGSPSGYSVTNTTAEFNYNLPISLPVPDPAQTGQTGIPGVSLQLKGDIRIGDTFTLKPEVSVFSVLDSAIRDIGNAPDNGSVPQAVNQALTNIDISLERVSAVRGQAGDLLNRADRIASSQEKRNIQLEADRSRAEDLDMIKGISDFNNQQTGYSAALQTYAKIQKMSLFDFIG